MTESRQDHTIEWIAREAQRPVVLPPSARARLLDAVRAEPTPRRPLVPLRWLLRRRVLALSPLGAIAMAAGLVGIGVFAGLFSTSRDGRSTGQPQVVAAPIPQLPVSDTVIKFVLVAPHASSVSLVGDFNEWNPAATPMTRSQSSGLWTVTLPLGQGRHLYAFMVNGTQWVADPGAPVAPDDGFGHPNSVLLVTGRTPAS